VELQAVKKTARLLLFSFFLTVLCSICIFIGIFVYMVHSTVIDLSVLENYTPDKPTVVLDRDGHEWTRFQLDRRASVALSEIPQCVVDAFLVTEDRAFFSHYGVSLKGIVRSVFVNFRTRRLAQGASTITQQLVKLLFFDAQRTMERKLKEQFYSFIIEWRMSKQQILETYLNHVYFGSGIYGVEAACQRFWGKSVREITYREAAMLAGIVRSPVRYCPLINPENAQKRRSTVLDLLYNQRYISKQDCVAWKSSELINEERITDSHMAPHLKEMIRQFLETVIGSSALYTQGYVVQSTIDFSLQQQAEKSFHDYVVFLRNQQKAAVDGAIISIDAQSGAIRALVGGYSFRQSQFNRVYNAKRQMGSSLKPFLYLSAIEQGHSFVETDIDEPLAIQTSQGLWEPRNANRQFDGSMTLAYALACSNNIIAVKTLLKVGANNVINCASKCGIKGPFEACPALALGCVDAFPIEVCAAFNVIANHGVYVEPYYIEWIKDSWGHKIWRHSGVSRAVAQWNFCSQTLAALQMTMDRMHSMCSLSWIDCACAGKTGTTNDARTCWFVGSTPTLTTTVYFGRDDNVSMGLNTYAMSTALPLWMSVMKAYKEKQKEFTYAPGLSFVHVDSKTGKRVSEKSDNVIKILVPE
jgi:penicillin-binding protein 1A